MDRKYGVLTLERCGNCRVLFRTPTTSSKESSRYYQAAYRQGFTTDLPTAQQLAQLKVEKFAGSGKDFSAQIAVLKALGVSSGARILDFGCSWGYGTWQLREAGFDAVGFELSTRRFEYARDVLSLPVVEDPWDDPDGYDVVFSSHVVEHVPDPVGLLKAAINSLRPGGIWISFCPNGSYDFKKSSPREWHQLWGLDHPIFPDADFFLHQAGALQSFMATTPCQEKWLSDWSVGTSTERRAPLDGGELLVVIRKPRK